MKGIAGFIGIAVVIYVFWITFEYFYNKRRISKNGNNPEKSSKTKTDER